MLTCLLTFVLSFSNPRTTLTRADYVDRVRAAWTGQMLACIMGWQFEHQVASTQWVDRFPKPYTVCPVDDDWYYEMVALRGFEHFGFSMTVQQLGQMWKEHNCGSWGSSEQARLLLARGIVPPDTGHPRYNKLWFTIGPQFSSEIYGLIAPGLPNVAGRLARKLCHINGYAEGVDGAVFIAGMVSLAFVEHDTRQIVRKAARLIHPDSPYRQCLDQIVELADKGKTAQEIIDTIEDRWHVEYPATNNAVANGGIVAVALWFGGGDFLKTVNIAYRSADFTDADCNAANAAAVIGAMCGMKSLPADLVKQLDDRIVGSEMGGVKLTPPVDERITDLSRRTAVIGEKLIQSHGIEVRDRRYTLLRPQITTQALERFRLCDLMKYWNKDWTLERAGFGGAGGGLGGIRGITHLEGDILATYPRDEVRGLVLRRSMKMPAHAVLSFEAAADWGRAWQLEVYAGNRKLLTRLIEGSPGARTWIPIHISLSDLADQSVTLRLYQRVLLSDRVPGNAYWRSLKLFSLKDSSISRANRGGGFRRHDAESTQLP